MLPRGRRRPRPARDGGGPQRPAGSAAASDDRRSGPSRRARGRPRALRRGARGRAPAAAPGGRVERRMRGAGGREADRRRRQRLSAAVRDLHRAGDPRRSKQRGVPLEIWSLRHPTEKAVHPMHRRIRARGELPAGISAIRSRCASCAASCGACGSRASGISLRVFWRDLAARSDAEPHPAPRPGLRPRARTRRRQSRICMCITCTRRPPSCATRRCSPAGPGPSRPTPRTSGRRRAGKSARRSPTRLWGVTCTRKGCSISRRSLRRPSACRSPITASTSPASRLRRTRGLTRDGSDPADPVRIVSVGRAVAEERL